MKRYPRFGEGLDGMNVNERLCATGLLDTFDQARAARDGEAIREILEAIRVDELSIARTLRDIAAAP